MSYITKQKDTMNKGEKNLISINKAMFAFASTFADPYFADSQNWKKIAIHYKHETSNQRKIIPLMEESSEAYFQMSEMARTGNWQVEQIQIFDKDGDMVSIPRSDMPSPSGFDFTTVRKIAPSETIVAINEGPQKLVLGSGKGALYEPGFKVRLWNDTLLNYHDNNIYTINSIVGDTLTLDQAISNYGAGGPVVRWESSSPNATYNEGVDYITLGANNSQSFSPDNLSAAIASQIQVGDIVTLTHGVITNHTVVSVEEVYNLIYNGMDWTNEITMYNIHFDSNLPVTTASISHIKITGQDNSVIKPLRLKFPNFSDASPKQKGIYQFIGSTF